MKSLLDICFAQQHKSDYTTCITLYLCANHALYKHDQADGKSHLPCNIVTYIKLSLSGECLCQ